MHVETKDYVVGVRGERLLSRDSKVKLAADMGTKKKEKKRKDRKAKKRRNNPQNYIDKSLFKYFCIRLTLPL